jgi:hypothetical protein
MSSHSPCPCWEPCPGKLIGCSPSTPKLAGLHDIIVRVAAMHDAVKGVAAEGSGAIPVPRAVDRISFDQAGSIAHSHNSAMKTQP